jgi:hypothetical protein
MKRPEKRTRHFNILLILLAVVAAAGGAWSIVGVSAHSGPARWGGAWTTSEGNHGIARLCAEDRAAGIEAALAYSKHALAVTPEQAAAWQGLVQVVRGADTRIGQACAGLADAAPDDGAPRMLENAEAAAATGLAALREVRPAFEAFYGVLDTEQRARIDGLLARHGAH